MKGPISIWRLLTRIVIAGALAALTAFTQPRPCPRTDPVPRTLPEGVLQVWYDSPRECWDLQAVAARKARENRKVRKPVPIRLEFRGVLIITVDKITLELTIDEPR